MTLVLDGKNSNSVGLLAPPARSTNLAVSDISLNVQENGLVVIPPKVHLEIKSGISEELKNRVLDISSEDLVPSEKLWTTNATEAVKLKMGKDAITGAKPMSIPTMIAAIVKKVPDHTALAYKKDDVWVEISYVEYLEQILKTAKAFLKLGLETGRGVGILGFNSLEWFLSYMGAVYCSSLAVGVYTTNSPETCQYVLNDSMCNIVCVENSLQLKKILKVKSELKDLKAIIQWRGEVEVDDPMVYSWEDFQKLGDDVADDLVVGRVKMILPNKCASLIYTSGTTGNPKGVMVSHDNLTWTAVQAATDFKFRYAKEIGISFLPLSHIAAQVIDIIAPLTGAGTTYFAQPDALKGSLAVTLREVRPTMFFAVPRVWEKFMEKLQALGAQNTGIKKAIGNWAKGIGLRGNRALLTGGSTPWGWTLANLIVFNKVRKGLGLDRCRYLMTGAAPISRETLDYFLSLNMPIYELYGMSESTGPQTYCMPGKTRNGSCGVDMSGVKTIILEPDAEGNGEICMYGRNVFMGYLNNEEKTKEAMDSEGLLHSGDIGRQDSDGFLYITGRIKELIITAGGENIAPVPIEDVVKKELPCVGNCMLIGDRRKFLSIMLTLKTEVDGDGNPLDQLTRPALDWCQQVGVKATTVTDISGESNEVFTKAIQAGVDRTNEQSVSRAQKIQKWILLPRDFSVSGGELGPTLKLRRPIVTKMYEKEIENFYEDC